MTTHRTTKRSHRFGRIRFFLIIAVIAVVTVTLGWAFKSQDKDVHEVRNDTPVEAISQPVQPEIVPFPTNRPISIKAVIPPLLSDEQRYGLWVVEQVLDDPERWVQKEKVEMSENDQQVFIALILTESSFRQFAEDGSTIDSGIDCDGLAQLCNNPAVCNPDDRWNPFENVYCGARYFHELIEKWDGNYTMAVAEYKGAINTLPSGQTTPNPDHPAVSDLFTHLSLR